jgi:hypothetical protein
MSVYVDDYKGTVKGKMMCFLTADKLDELHSFAEDLGLQREWAMLAPDSAIPQYPVTMHRRRLALARGAILVEHGYEPWRCPRCLRPRNMEGIKGLHCSCKQTNNKET